nr:SWIM zinc finger family protein [Halococcus thailandensis]
MVVCRNGYVNIVNQSHNDDSNHTYSVEVTDDGAVSCSCPHYQQWGQTCKHMVAVTDRPLTLSSAQAAQSTHNSRMFTDGGSVATEGQNDPESSCEECGDTEPVFTELTDVSDNDWNEYDKLCSECVIEVGGPDRSSNGDDSHGVVDVGRCRCGNTVTGDDEYCSERCRERGEIDTASL